MKASTAADKCERLHIAEHASVRVSHESHCGPQEPQLPAPAQLNSASSGALARAERCAKIKYAYAQIEVMRRIIAKHCKIALLCESILCRLRGDDCRQERRQHGSDGR
jgi:hypothetical protein